MKKRLKKAFNITAVLSILLLVVVIPVNAQIFEPDAGFSINQVEAYRNYLELNDQLYLITATIEYTATPNIQVDDAYIARLMTAAGAELGTTTFYPLQDSGYDIGIASIYFDAASAPAWNQPYEIHLQGNPTLHWLDTTAVHSMTGAKSYNATTLTFIDQTVQANDAVINDLTLIPAALPVVNDAYYFGSSGQFNIQTLKYSTPSAGPAWTGTYDYEYWNGAAWVSIGVSLSDPTLGFTSAAGTYDITWDALTDWQTTVVDGDNFYWVRFRVVTVTAGGGAIPLGDQAWTNTLDNPPAIQTDVFSIWYDDGTISGTGDRLTARVRSIATVFENDWGGTTDLIQTLAGVQKLTALGEDYFTNSIPGLRTACPNLFADVMITPDFGEKGIITDANIGGDNANNNAFGVNWFAQTFTAGSAYDIDGVWLKMFRVGSPGNVTVSVRATAAGLPAGADLAVGTLNANNFTFTTTGEWYYLTFTDDTALTSGTVYSIVLRALAGNANNNVRWRIDTTGTYAGGQAALSVNSGVAWAAIAGQDFMFITTGTDALEMSYRDILASRLEGTRFDMSAIGASFGLSRMWASTIVWFLLTIPIAWAATKTTNSYKPVMPIMALLMPIGALSGFILLEVAILIAFFFAASSIYVLFYRQAP